MPVSSGGLSWLSRCQAIQSNFFISGATTAAIIAVSLSYMFEQFSMGSMFVMLPIFSSWTNPLHNWCFSIHIDKSKVCQMVGFKRKSA
jgi:hypothetical protein